MKTEDFDIETTRVLSSPTKSTKYSFLLDSWLCIATYLIKQLNFCQIVSYVPFSSHCPPNSHYCLKSFIRVETHQISCNLNWRL